MYINGEGDGEFVFIMVYGELCVDKLLVVIGCVFNICKLVLDVMGVMFIL